MVGRIRFALERSDLPRHSSHVAQLFSLGIMNRFAIEDSFAVEPDSFVFAGRVIEGRAQRGMVFEVPEAGHKWRVTVRAVEFIRKCGGDELTGLVVQDADYLPGLGSGWTADLYEADA